MDLILHLKRDCIGNECVPNLIDTLNNNSGMVIPFKGKEYILISAGIMGEGHLNVHIQGDNFEDFDKNTHAHVKCKNPNQLIIH